LPEIELDDSQAAAQDDLSAEIDRLAAAMGRDAAAPAQAAGERLPETQSDGAPQGV
jgi:hypothetical protein